MSSTLDITPVEETKLPRYCIFRGKKVRIIGYLPKTEYCAEACFRIVDGSDTIRFIRRSQIERFVK